MTTEPTIVAPAPAPSLVPRSKKGLFVIFGVLALVVVIVGALVWLYATPEPVDERISFRMVENGEPIWYTLSDGGTTITEDTPPAWYKDAPAGVLVEGDFSPAVAGNGSVVALSPLGLETIDATTQGRSILIEREGAEPSSSAVNGNASSVVLYNTVTNEFDVFSLDNVRPTVLSYEGSVKAPQLFYGVGLLSDNRLIIRTTQTAFDVYEVRGGVVTPLDSFTLAEAASVETSFFEIPVAHAWTYGTPLTSTGATSAASKSCTGAVITSLGDASGEGAMPSIQTMAWNYMGTQSALPANYNSGAYCIQAETATIFEDSGAFNIFPKAHAVGAGGGSTGWELYFTLHSGAGTASAPSRYSTLTYAGTPTPEVTLSASPSTIDQGSTTLLTWLGSSVSSCTGTGFSTGGETFGSVSVSPTVNTTYSVSCVGTGSPTDSATVTVLVRPNLVVSAIGPTIAVSGVSSYLEATVQNSGVAATEVDTSVRFERSASSNGASPTTISTQTVNALPVNASEDVATTYTFSTGTTYVRACSDSTGVVSESNESDNCSAWTPVSAVASAGEGVWVENGYAERRVCNGDNMINLCPTDGGGVGSSCSPVGTKCSGTFDAEEAASYCLNDPGGTGTWGGFGEEEIERYECVAAEAVADIDVNLTATPDTIDSGESSTLSWTSSGAEVCTSDDFETADDVLGSFSVSPLETTSYLITCFASAADAQGGSGDGINVPVLQDEWWTGGTSDLVWGESVHNNDFAEGGASEGYGFEEVCASYATGYDAWNMQIRDTERTGDAGTNIAYIRCYGINDPTGTEAKPPEQHVTNHAWQPNGGVEYTTYMRSDSSNGVSVSDSVASSIATVTVGDLVASCSASPTVAGIGDTVTWTVNVSGGNTPYEYEWSGTDGLTGNSASVVKSYTTSGTKTALVAVMSPHVGIDSASAKKFSLVENIYQAIVGIFSASFAHATMTSCEGGGFVGFYGVGGGCEVGPGDSGTTTNTDGGTSDYIIVACDADSNPGDGTVTISGPSVSCDVAPSSIAAGESALYTATPSGGATGPYTWTPTGGASCPPGTGSTKECTFPTEGQYQMTVTATGTGNPSDTCTFVEVGADPVAYIESDQDRVNVGDVANLTWSADNVTSCTVTGSEGYDSGVLAGPTIATSTPVSRVINTQSSFTISCDNGAATHTAIVNIPVNIDEF